MNHNQSVHVTTNRRIWVFNLCVAMALMLAFSSGVVVKQTRTVRVGVYQNEPKIFMDENGQASGIFIELLDKIAAQEGWALVYMPCEWTACLQALEDGQIDLMPDVAYSTERAVKYDFHKIPVIESWSRVYASPVASITKISDLDGKRIAVLEGSIQQTVFEQLMNGFGYQVTIVPVDSFEQAFALTADGSVDAAIANHLFGDYFHQKHGLLKTTIDFNPVALYYATAEGRNPDLLEAIDRDLGKWIPEPDSPYYTTLGNWTEKEPYRLPKYIFWVIGGSLGLLVFAAGLVILLRRQVGTRTRKLEQANAELQESKQRYQTLARISPVGIFRTDPNGATTYVNPKWCAISGLSADQALEDGWLKAVHPDDREKLSEGWQKSTQLREASFSDYRFVHPDGTLAWVMGQAVPEMNSDNQIIGYVGTITDITERKRGEAALRESEQKLRAIFEQAPLGIAVIDSTTGRFRTINPQYCNIAGYSESEMLDLTFQRITHPDDLQTDLNGLQNMREGNLRLFQMEKRYIRKDGSAVWVGLTSVPLWDEPGADLQHIAMVEDITERKQVEAALQASERQLSLIYANISYILFYLAVEAEDHFRFVSVNPAFLKATGLPEDQIVGKLAKEVIPESAHTLVFGNYKEAVRTKKAVGWEEVSVYPSGKKYGEVSIIPILDADGNCTHLIGTVHDITERKQAEEELRRLADEFASLYEIAREITVQSNLSTLLEIISDRTARLLNTSDAVIYLYDSVDDRLELVAANVYALPRGTRLKVGEGVSSQVVRTRQSLIIDDYRMWNQRRPELEQLDVRAVAQVPLIYRDEVIGVLGIAEIGTERKFTPADTQLMELLASQVAIAIQNARLRTELEDYSKELEQRVLERTTQLQAANKELESFSYSVSHDLRAPLRAISGFSEIIARRHRASLNVEGRHYIDNIVQASERMAHLIDDLLTYARLGRTGVRREPVSLASLLGELARNMQSHLEKNHGTLNIDEDMPVVIGDHTLLSQVFTNLLENAFKYHKPDVPPQISLTYDNKDRYVVVKVSDNGIGIPLEYQEKIFNVFQRLHSEEEYPGTGIGLATVKKSVELLRGSIWVESEAGAGSMFFVRLPKE